VVSKPSKTSESMKKNKPKNVEDGDVESEKRVKKPNPKITRIKVSIIFPVGKIAIKTV